MNEWISDCLFLLNRLIVTIRLYCLNSIDCHYHLNWVISVVDDPKTNEFVKQDWVLEKELMECLDWSMDRHENYTGSVVVAAVAVAAAAAVVALTAA